MSLTHQTAYELPLKFGISKKKIITHLSQISKVKNWVSGLIAFSVLLSRHKSEQFLNRIVTCEMVPMCSVQLLDKNELRKNTQKCKIHWWFNAGINHYVFIKFGFFKSSQWICPNFFAWQPKIIHCTNDYGKTCNNWSWSFLDFIFTRLSFFAIWKFF